MNLKPESFKDDYLPFLRKVMMLYYKNIFVRQFCKIYLTLYFLIHSSVMIVTAVKGWKANHLYNAITLFISIHEVATVILVEVVHSHVMHMDELMHKMFWSTSGATKRLMENLHQLIQIIKIIFSVGLISIIIVCIGAVLYQIHPDWPIINKNNPLQYAILLVAFSAQCLGGGIIAYIYCSMFFYTCIHVHVQMGMLTEYLKHLSKDAILRNNNRLVKNRMLLIIKQHCRLSRFAKEVTRNFGDIYLAIPLLTSMVYFSANLYVTVQERLSTMVIYLISFILVPCLYCITGELFSSGFEKFSVQLYKCCWYEWNHENRKTTLLFLIFSQRVYVIRVFPPICARVTYIFWTLRMLYSALAVLKSTII
ncbi:Odorant receptor Or88 [Rhyzopertha dominica]|nr:Odorant receptor Or88 [Rhyzopertha dominica]